MGGGLYDKLTAFSGCTHTFSCNILFMNSSRYLYCIPSKLFWEQITVIGMPIIQESVNART